MNFCVFCGSSSGKESKYKQAAEALGHAMASQNIDLVYGGANVGLMGTIADAVLSGGGRVYGVIPKALEDVEIAHTGLTELHVVGSMHERKAMMAELSNGFIALPGGIGTLEELFEIWTWTQLGFHTKPVAILNVDHFYDPLQAFLDQLVNEQFVKKTQRDILINDSEPDKLLTRMKAYKPAFTKKWISTADL